MADGLGWTFETFKKYVDEKFAASERAILKAEIATDKRFDGVNEFRNALNDLSNRMLTRQEYDIQHKALSVRLEEYSKRIDTLQIQLTELSARNSGKAQGMSQIGMITWGIIAVVASVVTTIILTLEHFSK